MTGAARAGFARLISADKWRSSLYAYVHRNETYLINRQRLAHEKNIGIMERTPELCSDFEIRLVCGRTVASGLRSRDKPMAANQRVFPSPDSDVAFAALRQAIKHHFRQPADVNPLRPALRQFCVAARRDQLLPEEVLIRLKSALDELSDVDTARVDVAAARSRIVSLAIEAYFKDAEPD
jgi:hypothetical protein